MTLALSALYVSLGSQKGYSCTSYLIVPWSKLKSTLFPLSSGTTHQSWRSSNETDIIDKYANHLTLKARISFLERRCLNPPVACGKIHDLSNLVGNTSPRRERSFRSLVFKPIWPRKLITSSGPFSQCVVQFRYDAFPARKLL